MQSDCPSESLTFDMHDLENLISYLSFVLVVRGVESEAEGRRFESRR